MKKFFFPILVLLSTQSFAAEAPKVKLGGSIDTQIGYRHEKAPYDTIQDSTLSASLRGKKHHNSAIVNDTRLNVNVDGAHEGIKYGAVIKLFADTSDSASGNSNKGDKVYGYFETKFGRLEGANTKSASHSMMISGKDVTKATGGIDGSTYNWYNNYVVNNLTDSSKSVRMGRYFARNVGLPTFSKNKSAANKLVYYTPKYNGLQAGISYIPDSGLNGTASEVRKVNVVTGSEFKNILDASIRYDGKCHDVGYGVSLSGEIGKAKNGSNKPDRTDMKAWVVGGKASYKGATLAASYSDWMKTGRPLKKLPGAKFGSKQWTAGLGYDIDKLGLSVTYMKSLDANQFVHQASALADQDLTYNKYQIVSVGADYKLMPGMLTYAEVNRFFFNRLKSAANNKGTVMLTGVKLAF